MVRGICCAARAPTVRWAKRAIPSLLDRARLFAAYGEAFDSAQSGHPTLIYPTGFGSFAAHVARRFAGCGLTLDHLGIVDPQIAPSDHYLQVWEHYGMTVDALMARVKRT